MWHEFVISVVDRKLLEMLGDNAPLEDHKVKLHVGDIKYFHGTSTANKDACTVLFLDDGSDITVKNSYNEVNAIHSKFIADANS